MAATTKEKQKQIIIALILEPNKQKACESVGITTRTLYNLMQDADFVQEYNKAVDSIIDDTAQELGLVLKNSIIELNRIITTNKNDVIRLKAIKIALECLQYADHKELYKKENDPFGFFL